jgi:hypothetical protein
MNNAAEKYKLKKYIILNKYIIQLMMHIFLSQSALCMVMQHGCYKIKRGKNRNIPDNETDWC